MHEHEEQNAKVFRPEALDIVALSEAVVGTGGAVTASAASSVECEVFVEVKKRKTTQGPKEQKAAVIQFARDHSRLGIDARVRVRKLEKAQCACEARAAAAACSYEDTRRRFKKENANCDFLLNSEILMTSSSGLLSIAQQVAQDIGPLNFHKILRRCGKGGKPALPPRTTKGPDP